MYEDKMERQRKKRECLLAIIDGKKNGKSILHKFPPMQSQFYKGKTTYSDVIEHAKKKFSYFGLFDPEKVAQTSNGPINERSITEMLSANQKLRDVVLAVDDKCVFISWSSFIHCDTVNVSSQFSFMNSVGCFTENEHPKENRIQSFNIVWCTEDFQNVELIKHKISYLSNILEHRENHDHYISKQIPLIHQKKEQLIGEITQRCQEFFKKQGSQDEIKVNYFLKQLEDLSVKKQKQIQIFCLLERFYNCVKGNVQFELKDESFYWNGSTSGKQIIPETKKFGQDQKQKVEIQKNILNRTLITFEKKISKSLPSTFYNEHVQSIYEYFLQNNRMTIKQNLQLYKDKFSRSSTIHTLRFLLENNLAVSVSPFNNKSYNLYYLRKILSPSDKTRYKSVCQNQNSSWIKEYNKLKQIKKGQFNQKYLIVMGILCQAKAYIYKIQTPNSKSLKPQMHEKSEEQKVVRNIVQKYANKHIDINQIINTRPPEERFITYKTLSEFIRKKKIFQSQVSFFCTEKANE